MPQDHALLGNCLACGKIVCAQEGLGPCLYCGAEFQGKLGSRAPAKTADAAPKVTSWSESATLEGRHGGRLDGFETSNGGSETRETSAVGWAVGAIHAVRCSTPPASLDCVFATARGFPESQH